MLTQVGRKEHLVQLSFAGNLEDTKVALSPSRPCALEKVSGKGKKRSRTEGLPHAGLPGPQA